MAAAALCFVDAEQNLIKFKLYYNWSSQLGERYLKFKQTDQICSPLKISHSINVE